MNKHIKQIYSFSLTKKAPISQLRVYVAAYGILEEIEWEYDDGLTLQHEETYRYHTIQEYINHYSKDIINGKYY